MRQRTSRADAPVSKELTIYNQRLARPTLTSTSTGVASRHLRTPPATPSRPIWMRMESVLVSPKLLWLVVLLGVVVRVRQYAANRSLWLDESLVALNIIGRGMHRLLTAPLDFNQTAPAGFLFVEKLSAELFDKGEYALRAFPLLCGIVGLLLYPKLALRVVGPAGAVIAVALFAFSEPLIYYSSELKPYAGDIAATLAIALVGLATLDHRLSIRRAVAYGFLGFVLIQLTYAGILAAAGTGAALITIFLLTVVGRIRAP